MNSIKPISCNDKRCPRVSFGANEEKELKGFNKPRSFFANLSNIKETAKTYATGIPSALGSGLAAGAAVYGISDLAVKTYKYGKEGGFIDHILKPYGKAIAGGVKKGFGFIGGLFKKDFGKAVKDVVFLPFRGAKNYINSIIKNPNGGRGIKILALAAFGIVTGTKIVKTKMELNQKRAEIDHSYRIKHKTAIPPGE